MQPSSAGNAAQDIEFPPSYDRRLPLSATLDAGWGTARTDKGDFDYACPDCLASRAVESPMAVPDDRLSRRSRPNPMRLHRCQRSRLSVGLTVTHSGPNIVQAAPARSQLRPLINK